MRVLLVIACLAVRSLGDNSDQITDQLKCGQHEVATCVHPCPPEKTCRNRGIAFSCLYEDKPCTKKCICEDGYYRNSIGDCITGEQCDKCQKPHEFYSCNSACDNECKNIATQNRTHCPIVNIKCNEWCYCDDGYARDGYGNCVPVSQCPKAVPSSPGRYVREDGICGPNEYFTCRLPCPPETCLSLVAKFRCQESQVCKPECACKPGFLRMRPDTPCIPIYTQCGPNEYFTCKTNCPPETCLSLVARFKCDSKEVCKSRCACKPGFLRVKDGTPCVPTCQCPELRNSPDCEKKY